MAEDAPGLTLRDYLGVMWRWKWLVILVVVVATGAAYYFSWRQTPMYQASTTLLYERQLDLANPLGGSYSDVTQQSLDVESVGTVISSPDMRSRAEQQAGRGSFGMEAFSVTAAADQPESQNTTRYVSSATITATSPDAQLAVTVANAYAEAFIEWRKGRQKAQVKQAEKVLENELAGFTNEESKTSADYILLEQRLRDLQILEATATGDFRVVRPATAPTAPYEPRPLRSAILGFGVGLFAGIGLAFLLEQFNTRLRSHREAAEILQLPIVGRIPRIAKRSLAQNALDVLENPDGGAAESVRMLRGNLEFLNVDGELKSLFMTSALQGEGKSVTLANLAVSLALAGKRIVVVDADLRRPRMHRYFDLANEVGLTNVLTGKARLLDSLQPVVLAPGSGNGDNGSQPVGADGAALPKARLYVLTSGPLPPNPGELIASRRFGGVIEELERETDMVLIDSPAIMAVGDGASVASVADGVLVLVNMEQISRPLLREVKDIIDPLPCQKLGMVAVREKVKRGDYYRYRYYKYKKYQAD